MKNMILAVALLFTFHTNAALIEFDFEEQSYNSGDFFNVLITVDNSAGNIEEIDFEIDYDVNSLIFDSFSFDFDNTFTAIAFSDEFALGTVELWSWWSELDTPNGIFELGFATFKVADLGGDSYLAAKSEFDLVVNTVVTAEVPEPSTMLIMLLGLGIILIRQTKLVK
jgi:hypothetical protein